MRRAASIHNPLRVICGRCATVVKVHHQEVEAWGDTVMLWIECHGEHKLCLVDGEGISSLLSRPDRPLLMEDLKQFDAGEIEERRAHAEETLIMLAKRLAAYEHFLSRTDGDVWKRVAGVLTALLDPGLGEHIGLELVGRMDKLSST
jgi:hypothetical protein